MIIWCGFSGSKLVRTVGRYRPPRDPWDATRTKGSPSGRGEHTGVWTGDRMIIWGGQDNSRTNLKTGKLYDPSTNSWRSTTTSGAPSPRRNQTAIWTGTEMIIWGGTS